MANQYNFFNEISQFFSKENFESLFVTTFCEISRNLNTLLFFHSAPSYFFAIKSIIL